jgi:2-polyprenyl-3-methyl-5-hydroxy-6-metoxy-1,4-benzoquinol methylase
MWRQAEYHAARVAEYRYSDDQPAFTNAYLWPVLRRLLAQHAPPPQRVFELGCGNGATAHLLALDGYSVVAVDPSASGIAIAKRYESDRLRFEPGSISEDLKARFGTFPVVLSLEVIEHCPSAREFMSAFCSLLAPGGIGIISTPYHGYLKNLLVVASGNFDHHFDPLWEGGHLKFFTRAKLAELFAENNLRQPEFHRVGRVPALAKSVIAVVRAEP